MANYILSKSGGIGTARGMKNTKGTEDVTKSINVHVVQCKRGFNHNNYMLDELYMPKNKDCITKSAKLFMFCFVLQKEINRVKLRVMEKYEKKLDTEEIDGFIRTTFFES